VGEGSRENKVVGGGKRKIETDTQEAPQTRNTSPSVPPP